jgi:hypothetical protein
VPVTVIATVPNVLDVSTKLPVKNLAEFIAYLKANPKKVSYASQGNGSTSHLTAELFMQLTGTEMVHVPYKGTAPALVDVVGGTVDVFFDNLSSSLAFHNGGKLRILAVADQKRAPLLPNVPTFVESRLPGHGGRDLLLHRRAARHPPRGGRLRVQGVLGRAAGARHAEEVRRAGRHAGRLEPGPVGRLHPRRIGKVEPRDPHRQRESGVT